MSKQPKIRWQKSDSQDLAKAVKNFNAKIERVAKKNPEIKNALPDKVSVKQLKELIQTRRDLQREINSLKRFSKRGSEEIITYGDYNVKITKWQKTEINRRLGIINRRRKQRLDFVESLELTQGGQSLGYTKRDIGMGKIERVELSPMQGLTPGMNQRDISFKWKGILKESQSTFYTKKDYQCRLNYIKGLEENFNKDAAEIKRAIMQMDIGDFLKIFYSEADANFEGLYFPTDNQYQGYLSKLKSIWITNADKTLNSNLDKIENIED